MDSEMQDNQQNESAENITADISNAADVEMESNPSSIKSLEIIIHSPKENDEPQIFPDISEQCTTTEDKILVTTQNEISEEIIRNEVIHECEYFKEKTIVEISRIAWKTSYYLRGCCWSPDGTCCLTAVNGDGMHLIELPKEFYDTEAVDSMRPIDVLQSAVHVPEGGTVYDYCWYPHMNSMMPDTCCWLASRQHEPIHMWDAFDGKLRCSYRGYDDVDEVEPALSLAFSPDGSQIYAGYKKSLKIFSTAIPGRDYSSFKTKSTVSAIATNYYQPNVIVLGSWNKTILLCDPRAPDLNVFNHLDGHSGGVTLIKFTPDGEHLLSGSRKENKILRWDMRNLKKPMSVFQRNVETNQRIYFDISYEANWLLSGDTRGEIHIWNLKDPKKNTLIFPLHRDCCNGVSLHPTKKVLATSTGQYHGSINDADEDNFVTTANMQNSIEENSLIFWWFGKYKENTI